jgi:hypothetical protein
MSLRRSAVALASVGLMAAGCAACGSSSPSNGTASLTPAKAESAVTAAIKKATGVRVVTTITENGHTVRQTVDAGQGIGRLTVDVAGGTAHILVAKRAAYLEGTTSVLESVFGLPTTTARKDAGHWLSFAAGTSGYSSLSTSVTTSSVAEEVALTKVVRRSHAAIDHRAVIALVGHNGGTSGDTLTLVVPTHGAPLPVSGRAIAKGLVVTLAFSEWNRPVTVTPPAHSTPFSAS